MNSYEFIELKSLYLRISYHNIYPISHVHTVPIDGCAFLYAFITNGSMCFPSLFIQTIVDIYRSKSKGQKLFFPVYINRILRFLGLSDFPHLELVHITAPIGATFLRQGQAQMKSAEPSTGTSKRSKGEASTTASSSEAMPTTEEVHVDPTAAMDPFGDDDHVDPMVTLPLSLHAMVEPFMTT